MTISSVRTLFITRDLPYPPMGGAPLRNWQNINILRKYGSVAIFSVFPGNPDVETLPGVELWHHYNMSHPLSRWEKSERQGWLMRPRGYPQVDRWYAIAAGRELERVIAKFRPNLIIFEEIWLYRYLKWVKQHDCPLIFDNHNVEALLLQQQYRSLKARKGIVLEKIEVPRLKAIERDFIRQVDEVWLCSEDDADLLESWYGRVEKARVIPNGIDVRYYDPVRLKQLNLPAGLERQEKTLIFVASFSYGPNIEAARLLIDQIYPRLHKIHPDCRLLIVGKKPPSKLRESAQSYPNIIFTGTVPDVRPYLNLASVVVTPLLQGSGTRLKILEAFASGRPVVSTTKGVEGIKVKDGEHLLIRDEIDDFVAAIDRLWSQPDPAEKLAASAWELVKAEYSWEAVGKRIEKSIARLFP